MLPPEIVIPAPAPAAGLLIALPEMTTFMVELSIAVTWMWSLAALTKLLFVMCVVTVALMADRMLRLSLEVAVPVNVELLTIISFAVPVVFRTRKLSSTEPRMSSLLKVPVPVSSSKMALPSSVAVLLPFVPLMVELVNVTSTTVFP
jgi:hypothetical protein